MDNDDKMTSIKDPVGYFLNDLDVKKSAGKEEYSLEDHFKSSRKNKNWRIFLVIFLLAVALALSSWAITKWIETRNTADYFQLNEFKDVDFMGILNETEKTERELSAAENALISLKMEYENAQQVVKEKADHDLKLLTAVNRDDRGGSITEKENSELKDIDTKYLPLISEKKEKVSVIRDRLSSFDSTKVSQAREYEKTLADNSRKYELEKQGIIADYEKRLKIQRDNFQSRLKEMDSFQKKLEAALRSADESDKKKLEELYNPAISPDKPDLSKLAGESVPQDQSLYALPEIDPRWLEKGYVTQEEVLYLNNSIEQWKTLMGFLKGIPFKNDVPKVLNQLDYRHLKIIHQLSEKESADLESLNRSQKELAEVKADLKTLVPEKYRTFYDSVSYTYSLRLKELGGQGIVLEPNGSGDRMAFMDPLIDMPVRSEGYVYGNDNEYVGKVRLKREGLLYSLKTIQLDDGKKLQTFDRIFLKINNSMEKEIAQNDSPTE